MITIIFKIFFIFSCIALMFSNEYVSLYYLIQFFQGGSDKYDKFYKGFLEKYLILSDKLARNTCNTHEKD